MNDDMEQFTLLPACFVKPETEPIIFMFFCDN